MTIYDVANKLEKCAELKCEGCKHEWSKFGRRTYADCQALLIEEMEAECRAIAEGMEK